MPRLRGSPQRLQPGPDVGHLLLGDGPFQRRHHVLAFIDDLPESLVVRKDRIVRQPRPDPTGRARAMTDDTAGFVQLLPTIAISGKFVINVASPGQIAGRSPSNSYEEREKDKN